MRQYGNGSLSTYISMRFFLETSVYISVTVACDLIVILDSGEEIRSGSGEEHCRSGRSVHSEAMQHAHGEDAVAFADTSDLFYINSPVAMDDTVEYLFDANSSVFVDDFSSMPEFTSVSSSSSSSGNTPAPRSFSSSSSSSSALNPENTDLDSLDFRFEFDDVLDPSPSVDSEIDFDQSSLMLEKSSESDELAEMFLQWLKTNKESVSAEDLRNIKLNQFTVECAANRLGGGKDGKKRLLQLILQWVQQHQLPKHHVNQSPYSPYSEYINGPRVPPEAQNVAFSPSWIASPPCSQYCPPAINLTPPPCRSGDPAHVSFSYGGLRDVNLLVPSLCLQQLGSARSKEARKKRMARRFQSNQHRSFQSRSNSDMADNVENTAGKPSYVQRMSTVSPSPINTMIADCSSFYHPQSTPDTHQSWKTEKNLRFLLQKVLKQSDVSSIGRIVLPKKEAEKHLPQLEARDGITIAMEDIGSSHVWNMRYRFWPNNKSRMYLLENTGEFVRSNGLQEGDFIVLYSDVRSGKYLIRGVKVPQQGFELETKRTVHKKRATPNSATEVIGTPKNCHRGTVSYVSLADWV